jgi:hypothetical protein
MQYIKLQKVKQLMAFFGMFDFYRSFITAAAKILRLLTDTLRMASIEGA